MTIGYKKCYIPEEECFTLVELEIPEDAKITSSTIWAYSRAEGTEFLKYRASKAIVKKIHGGYSKAVSMYDGDFVYEVDKEAAPSLPWEDTDLHFACGNGVHYFNNKADAIEYDNGSYMAVGGNKQCAWKPADKPKRLLCIMVEDAKVDEEVETETSS